MNQDWRNSKELESKLIYLLTERHAGYVTYLSVSLEGDIVVLRGEVASEDCKGDAKRLALSFNGVFKVRNELVVAGFLEAATDGEEEDYFGQKTTSRSNLGSAPGSSETEEFAGGGGRIEGPGVEYGSYDGHNDQETVDVERRPVIDASAAPLPGAWVDLTIDLVAETREGERTISLGTFPADWSTITISVQVYAPWAAEVDTYKSTILLASDGNSEPALIRLRAADDYAEGDAATINVFFFHGTRICGHETIVLPDTAVVVSPVTQDAADSALGAIRVTPDAAGPSVSVTIMSGGETSQTWIWRALLPGAVMQGMGIIAIDGSHREFGEALLKECPALKTPGFRRTMRGIGESLWRAAPAEFRSDYLTLRCRLGSDFAIQFVTDDPHVPWEMMRPDDASSSIDHLFIEHPVARWPLNRAKVLKNTLPEGALLSFAPVYAAHNALTGAQTEADWIVNDLAGTRMPGQSAEFLKVLDGEFSASVGLLHFAGHGREDTGNLDGGIEFEDGVVSVQDIDNSGIKLGARDGTLIVLNACEVGSGGKLLGMNAGWGVTIAAREFGGLIAPLWEVQDDFAVLMVKATLPSLLDGSLTLGEALRDARRIHGERSIASFAYLAHGDVMARFATS